MPPPTRPVPTTGAAAPAPQRRAQPGNGKRAAAKPRPQQADAKPSTAPARSGRRATAGDGVPSGKVGSPGPASPRRSSPTVSAPKANASRTPPLDAARRPPAGSNSAEHITAALTRAKNATSTVLEEITGLSRPTITRLLRALEAAGQVTRTRADTSTGKAGRKPDLWSLAASAGNGTPRSVATTPGRGSNRRRHTPITAPNTASAAASPAPSATAAAPTARSAAGRAAVTLNPRSGTVRLVRGELTALVAGHFAKYPNSAFTATEIGHVLNRSGGACLNAMVKLAAQGVLVQTNEKPRRYTAAPTP